MENKYELNQKRKEIFWGELSPCGDLIKMYEDDDAFLDSLASFASEGIHTTEATIIIATSSHLRGLETRLFLNGINPDAARESGLYIPLDAKETLARFMVYGLPDETSFRQLLISLIERAKSNRIRALGEMVALLWGQGFKSATVKLQEFWSSFGRNEAFNLFCEYPQYGFTKDIRNSISDISRKHSEIIADWKKREYEAVHPSSVA